MRYYPMYWRNRIIHTLNEGLATLIGCHLRIRPMNLLTFVSTFVNSHIKVPEH